MAQNIAAAFGRAMTAFQENRFEAAIADCRKILVEYPRHIDAWQMIGLSFVRLKRKELAVEPLEMAVRIQPKLAPLCNNLGEIYRQVGRLQDSERVLREALALQDKFAAAALNLGNTLKDQNRYPEAIEWFQKTIDWQPNYANAHLNLANTLLKEGHVRRAVRHYHDYLRLQPARCDVLLSLGGAYADLGEHDNARTYYQQAAVLEPDSSDVDAVLGQVELVEGDIVQAAANYRRIAARQPDCLLKRLRADTLCEIIPPSNASIDDYRTNLTATLTRLQTAPLQLDLEHLHSSWAEPPMAIAYQGRDDRALKEQYAGLFTQRISPLKLSPRTGPPRLGVVVTSGHEGVYAECLGRLVGRLACSKDLDVTIICSRAGANIIPHLLGKSTIRYLPLADSVPESANRLAAAQFDLLHYWEVGTDSMNYFLPFFRPAPVQSACWGWPVTTGHPFIQYFVSSQWIEPHNAQAHYSEQLVPLETLPAWYLRPPVPREPRSRADVGWPAQTRIYLCTQNLRKYHPDFDPVLAAILRRDPEGQIFAIDDSRPAVGRRLHARFAGRFPDVASRLVIIPRQDRIDYLNTVMLADVMLDTPHYGGGANSLYDAFACGTPIVTRPGQFHRGRYGQGICRKLDLPEMIADSTDDFVTRAIQIASEPDFRESLQQKIRERSDQLFEDHSAVQQHERFFLEAIAKSRTP